MPPRIRANTILIVKLAQFEGSLCPYFALYSEQNSAACQRQLETRCAHLLPAGKFTIVNFEKLIL